jgi:DNA-binding NarL/FixJ family response regulator
MKVLVVDDHAIIRDALKRLLASFDPPAETVEAATGEDGLQLAVRANPDLVILDLNLPGLGGLELLDRLRRAAPHVPVLVLSMNADPIFARRALALGARGYVSKNADTTELVLAVRKVAGGGRYVESELAQALALAAEGQQPGLDALSERELEIMRLLSSGASLAEIAAIMGVAYKTTANALSRIKAKLNVARTADLIRLSIQAQLIGR